MSSLSLRRKRIKATQFLKNNKTTIYCGHFSTYVR